MCHDIQLDIMQKTKTKKLVTIIIIWINTEKTLKIVCSLQKEGTNHINMLKKS